MRILNCFTDPRIGGPGKRAIAVSKQLRNKGISTEFLIPKGDDSLANQAEEAGFETHRVSLPRIRSPRMIKQNVEFLHTFSQTTENISNLIDSLSIDVVHVNTPYNFQTARAAALSDASLVWHFNDTLTPWPINKLAGHAARFWADEIVVAANAVHDYFFSPKVNTRTIYAPVDSDEFEPSKYSNSTLRSELDIDQERFVLGAIGNLNPAKGHEYLINSVAQIDGKDHVELVIVGAQLDSQQHYYEKLRNQVENLGLSDRIHFTGWRSDVPELLSLFDLFVLPSITEACPIVVLEAMAMECPVVATDVGGVREQIPDDDHGWVVPPKNSEALAAAIDEAILSPQERQSRSRRARERIEAVFDLDHCVDAHIAAYRAALE